MTDKNKILKQANDACKETLMGTLDMEFVDIGKDYITCKMPVNNRVHQPDGILHGGATLALAESVGSFASRFSEAQNSVDRTNCLGGVESNGSEL